MTDRRTIVRYALFQIPDLVLLGLGLLASVEWFGLSVAAAGVILGLWIVKDIAMFPVLRVAYEAAPSHDRLSGAIGTAKQTLDPTGYISVGSESWKAELVGHRGEVPAGAEVRVVGLNGLTVLVEPAEPEDPPREEVDRL